MPVLDNQAKILIDSQNRSGNFAYLNNNGDSDAEKADPAHPAGMRDNTLRRRLGRESASASASAIRIGSRAAESSANISKEKTD
jgi:hypothetical protein